MTHDQPTEDDWVVIFSPTSGHIWDSHGLAGFTLNWYDCVVRRFSETAAANAEIHRLTRLLMSVPQNSRRPPTLDTLKGWHRPGWNRKRRRLYSEVPIYRTVLISRQRKSPGDRSTVSQVFLSVVVGCPNSPREPSREAHLIFEILPSWPYPERLQIENFPVLEYLETRDIG